MKYLGCAYYPEYWGRDRYATDARLMQEAGINLARIGEFAWDRMEPRENHFTLDWLHECVETLAAHGIDVLMCTPTATPPAWLTSAYPDTLLTHLDGSRAAHGRRRHYCPSSDSYRRHTARIAEKLAAEMASHKNVVAWQIDNELGPEMSWCFCENCQARFQGWLQGRYGSIEDLNRAWNTGFWSMDYSDWRQVRLGSETLDHYSARVLDSKRFFSDLMVDYARFQAAILRREHPGALVTTNGMGPIFSPIDYYQLFEDLDVACDDLYFDIATMDANAAAMNVFRAIKPGRPYWITETGSGALDHNRPPHKDQFRAWAWSSWMHGAEAHVVFRWRTALSGQEQELQGILEHSGAPRHRYQAVKDCFTEFARLRETLQDAPLPRAEVAIVQDYQVLWAYQASRMGQPVNYLGLVYDLHRKLYDRHVLADIIPPARDLSGYKLIILPSLMISDGDFAARLKQAAQAGATILSLGQIGIRDANNNYLPDPGPQHLEDLLGARLYGGMYLRSFVGPDEALWVPEPKSSAFHLPIAGQLGGQPCSGEIGDWAADAALAGGEALLTYSEDAYQGQPALVYNAFGQGHSLYLAGLRLDLSLANALVDEALRLAGVERGPLTPAHVEVLHRGPFTCAINHTAQPVTVHLTAQGSTLLGDYQDGQAHLGPYGVCLVREGSE
jgi:beta-galactosidase